MINRTVHMIFEPSGQPIPSEEEVQFEAREIVSRCGWGLPLLEALRRVSNPYWREAVARCLMESWQQLVRDKDEQTYYYDSDGDIRYCWMDAEYDFDRIIRRSTNEQVDYEQAMPQPQPAQQEEIARLISENLQLKYTITTMEEKYQQINIGTQNNNYGTVNNFYGDCHAPASGVPGMQEEPSAAPQVDLFRFIHPSVTDEAERIKVHREVENLVRTLPLPEICRYLMDMRKNCRVYLSVKPELMFEELHRMGMPEESTPGFSMKNFRSYFNVND